MPASLKHRTRRTLAALADRIPAHRVVPLSLLAGAALSVAVGAGVAEAVTGPSDTMPVSEIKPGMKGYGLTVFSGTQPEKFDIEVISTIRNFLPNQDLILVKTVHPRLQAARIVAGMSGSPIYLNGKMIGVSLYPVYTANVRGWISLAMIDEVDAKDGTEVQIVWGEENGGSRKPNVERHIQTTIRARIASGPFA